MLLLQALQAVLQALLQQFPATQNVLAHSAPVVQPPPFGFNPHDPLVQTWPAAQSAVAAQVPLQASTPHL
jgi:hypothetical protein